MDGNNSKAPAGHDEGPVWVEEWVPLASIQKLEVLQVRHRLDAGAVKRYRDMTRAGQVPPPIKVGRVEGCGLYLVDGWHRMEAGAIQTREEFGYGGTTVFALVAPLTEKAALWEAARANGAHGVPLKQAEHRNVFRAFIKAGQHRKGRGAMMSYREIGACLGKGPSTLQRWMRADFRKLADRMGGVDHGNGQAEALRVDVPSFAETQRDEAIRAAKATAAGLEAMTPTGRREVVAELRRTIAIAARLGVEHPVIDPPEF